MMTSYASIYIYATNLGLLEAQFHEYASIFSAGFGRFSIPFTIVGAFQGPLTLPDSLILIYVPVVVRLNFIFPLTVEQDDENRSGGLLTLPKNITTSLPSGDFARAGSHEVREKTTSLNTYGPRTLSPTDSTLIMCESHG